MHHPNPSPRGRRRTSVRRAALAVVTSAAVCASIVIAAPATAAPSGLSHAATQPSAKPAPATVDRSTLPRTVVTTDGELDDMNSFTRILYYTNELDIAGFVYTSSVHHWRGDGTRTLEQAKADGIVTSFRGQTAGTSAQAKDQTVWRWNPDAWMEDKIGLYGDIVSNLRVHDPNFPSEQELLSKVAVGNIDFENDFSKDTPGSDLIKSVLLDADERDVWLQAWGGQNTIARALLAIENQYKGTAQWEAIRAKVIDKAIIATIGNQDNAYADYIGVAWPEIRVYQWGNAFTTWVATARNGNVPEIAQYFRAAWWTENMWRDHGPLLQDYHVIGDGRYLEGESDAPGWQPGLAGVVYPIETWRIFGFGGPFEQFDFGGEGDTPSFLGLLNSGHRFLEDPSLGGWGGRLDNSDAAPTQFTVQGDLNPVTNRIQTGYSISRWVPDAARDFAARADWGVTSSFEDANHAPTVALSAEDLTASPGETVKVLSQVRDRDGDDVDRRWWVYKEASTVTAEPGIRTAGQGTAQNAFITVPADAQPGQRIVVMLTATDDGEHSLAKQGQVVITVK